jgi:hypothetical protein
VRYTSIIAIFFSYFHGLYSNMMSIYMTEYISIYLYMYRSNRIISAKELTNEKDNGDTDEEIDKLV